MSQNVADNFQTYCSFNLKPVNGLDRKLWLLVDRHIGLIEAEINPHDDLSYSTGLSQHNFFMGGLSRLVATFYQVTFDWS